MPAIRAIRRRDLLLQLRCASTSAFVRSRFAHSSVGTAQYSHTSAFAPRRTLRTYSSDLSDTREL
jgi:hypothetical protein